MTTIAATVNSTTVLLTLHIVAAVLWVGGGFTMHAFGRLAAKSGDRSRMNQFAIDAAFLGSRIYAPLSIVLLITGVFLADKVGYSLGDPWISIAFTAWLISFLLGVLYYSRADKRRAAVVESEGLDSDAFLASYRQVSNVNTIELTLLLVAILSMTFKPGA